MTHDLNSPHPLIPRWHGARAAGGDGDLGADALRRHAPPRDGHHVARSAEAKMGCCYDGMFFWGKSPENAMENSDVP